ncbi:cytochrome P450 [Sporormia fimetaria CBS 119925]|uniref:Cytochrome P450 n=1 Tax=Sporormia fimetaria CBS 119925 TaxID=1340428 RepID=A0A6A6V0V7_9PLEO|nr:cytochrome P450 [Sporormia fimetaria CBS 119925]
MGNKFHEDCTEVIIDEVFRWRYFVPGGIPHSNIRDDYYNGYLIPKGSVVIPCYASMRTDPALFDDPLAFIPERWEAGSPLKQQQSGPAPLNAFDLGRRVCIGRRIASKSLRIAIARMLWRSIFGQNGSYQSSSRRATQTVCESSQEGQGHL